MKKNVLLKILVLLIIAMFVAISCKNSSNNTVETFNLENSVTPANAGSVSPAGGSFEAGEQVQITATPNENWLFKEWNGDFSGSENPATVTITKNMNINALFEQLTYPLTIEIEGEGDVSEQIVNAKTDYTPGSMVELTGIPSNEWRFVEWTGDLESDENPAAVTMDGPKNITALFEFGFDEDFEDGVADNWMFSDDRFSVVDGKLRFSTGNDGNWGAAIYDQIFTDFKIEVKVTRTRSEETEDYTLAVFIRAEGDVEQGFLQNGYMIGITQSGWGAVFKYENGIETQFSPWIKFSELNDELGEYNIVTVNAVGSAFEIFINGEYIVTLTDDTFSEGYVGIGTYASDDGNNRVFWEYIKVTQADPLQNEKNKVYKALNHTSSVEGNGKGRYFEE